jgi:hypothetical protein
MISRTGAAGALLAALSICGCATPNNPPTHAAAGPSASSTCLTSTGSRIPPGPDTHCTARGRTYSQTDIDRTGRTTLAGALSDLDPSITVTH